MANASDNILGWAVGLALLAAVTHSTFKPDPEPPPFAELTLEDDAEEPSASIEDRASDATAELAAMRGIDPPTSYSGLTYGITDCTEDCSGHDAGYRWAELNGLEDADDCGDNSYSFIEGCVLYAEEQADEKADQEYEE